MSDAIARLVADRLAALADPVKAGQMAAYMKTDMPFYGVPQPARREILGDVVKRFPISSRTDYEDAVMSLWRLPHREEKYLAIAIAKHWDRFVVRSSLPLYRRLIRQGAWWDFVDDVAVRLVGTIWIRDREHLSPVMDRWVDDRDLWVRRSAIIGQLGHKEQTDEGRLFRYCIERAHETDFFIRKAIGWALREHAKTHPDAVRGFVSRHGDRLSGLSRREATKHL